MRILHITRLPITVTAFLMPILEEHRQRGDYAAVCCVDEPKVKIIRDAGFDCFTHRLARNLRPLNLLRAFWDIRRILLDNSFDAAVYHTPLVSGVGRLAGWSAGVKKKVYFAHGLPCAPMQNRIKWTAAFVCEWILGRITDGIVVMNRYDENLVKKGHLVKSSAKICRVFGVGVDINRFRPDADKQDRNRLLKELNAQWARNIVICATRLIKTKGVYQYVNAAFKVLKERNDVLFLLAGTGPSLEKLTNMCDSYGLQDHFKIIGWRDDMDRLMRVVDIFTLPSYYPEGLPVSILEAMACGKPVVSTKHRGCEDVVVDGQTGFLVPVEQVGPLVDKILLLLDSEQLRTQMGHVGRRRVEEHFEVGYCTAKIVEALEAIFKLA